MLGASNLGASRFAQVSLWWAVASLVMQGRVGWVPNAPHHILVLEDGSSLLAKGKDTWDSEGIVPLSPVPLCPHHGPCFLNLCCFSVIGFYVDVCMSLFHCLVAPCFVAGVGICVISQLYGSFVL